MDADQVGEIDTPVDGLYQVFEGFASRRDEKIGVADLGRPLQALPRAGPIGAPAGPGAILGVAQGLPKDAPLYDTQAPARHPFAVEGERGETTGEGPVVDQG